MAGKQHEIVSSVFLVFTEVTERGGFILVGAGNMHYMTLTLYCAPDVVKSMKMYQT